MLPPLFTVSGTVPGLEECSRWPSRGHRQGDQQGDPATASPNRAGLSCQGDPSRNRQTPMAIVPAVINATTARYRAGSRGRIRERLFRLRRRPSNPFSLAPNRSRRAKPAVARMRQTRERARGGRVSSPLWLACVDGATVPSRYPDRDRDLATSSPCSSATAAPP